MYTKNDSFVSALYNYVIMKVKQGRGWDLGKTMRDECVVNLKMALRIMPLRRTRFPGGSFLKQKYSGATCGANVA